MIETPPLVYQHPYTGNLIEVISDLAVKTYCPVNALACSIKGLFSTCLIILPENTYPLLQLHELAHCNGWVH